MESSGSNKTEIKDFSILPKTFDFMAYFDEGEPESTTDKSEGGSPHMEAYFEAGADYVISSLDELKELIRLINSRLLFHESMEN